MFTDSLVEQILFLSMMEGCKDFDLSYYCKWNRCVFFFFQRTASNRMEIWGRSNTITKEWFNSERPNETHAFNLSIYQRESKKYFDYIL